jgi:hypothetical protein
MLQIAEELCEKMEPCCRSQGKCVRKLNHVINRREITRDNGAKPQISEKRLAKTGPTSQIYIYVKFTNVQKYSKEWTLVLLIMRVSVGYQF